jgi:diguanylate cyclase (GGDEF)-like protein
VLDEDVDQDVEVDFVLPSGEWRSALMSVRTLLRPSGEVNGAIISVLDITDSVRARQELERRATFDALTGCHNRSSILSALQTELQQDNSQATALVYVDLDNFKSVNDTLGHAAGDELLVQVAERLKDVSRGNDDVGRLGGDEFIMLLRSISGADAAMQVAHRISESVGEAFVLSTGPVQLRASMGVACTGSETVTAEELIKRADAAMYLSKAQGDGLPVLDEDTAAEGPRTVPGSRPVVGVSPGR